MGGGGWRAADVEAVPTHILKLSTCSSGLPAAALHLTAGIQCQHKQTKTTTVKHVGEKWRLG